MIARIYIPPSPLSRFVRLIWYYDGYEQPHPKERLLPDGSMSLVLNLRDDLVRTYDSRDHSKVSRIPGHVFSGARSGFFVVDTANMLQTIGVQFHPGGAFPFLRMPASEVSEQTLTLDQLWGAEGADLRARVLETTTPEHKFRLLEQWLLQRLTRPLERNPAVAYALQQFQVSPSLAVGRMVDKIGFSQRHFIQLFTTEVGLTPKVFSRVRRFQQAVTTIGNCKTVDWVSLALECGYYDQAHFIHDFETFSGITPATYLERKTPHLNHVPMYE
jgi:AraC-like DNA-binding protein